MQGLVVAVVCLVAVSQAAILCPSNACDNIKCDAKLTALGCQTNGGVMKPKGGFCGCCDVCLQELGEGADCTSSLLLGVPATSQCAGDLYCDFQSRQCKKPTCAMKKKEVEDWVAKQPMPPLGVTIPTCDVNGTYTGKQCSKSQCYCVDVYGKSIGYEHNRWETNNKITCQCARDFAAYRARGIIGRLFHCTDKGDYETVQCTGSVCYCADINTGKQIDSVKSVHISAKATLQC